MKRQNGHNIAVELTDGCHRDEAKVERLQIWPLLALLKDEAAERRVGHQHQEHQVDLPKVWLFFRER